MRCSAEAVRETLACFVRRDAKRIAVGVQGVSRGASEQQRHSHPQRLDHSFVRLRQRTGDFRRCHPDAPCGYAQCRPRDSAQWSEGRRHHQGQESPPKRQKEAARQRAACKEYCVVCRLVVTCANVTVSHCSRQRAPLRRSIRIHAEISSAVPLILARSRLTVTLTLTSEGQRDAPAARGGSGCNAPRGCMKGVLP